MSDLIVNLNIYAPSLFSICELFLYCFFPYPGEKCIRFSHPVRFYLQVTFNYESLALIQQKLSHINSFRTSICDMYT